MRTYPNPKSRRRFLQAGLLLPALSASMLVAPPEASAKAAPPYGPGPRSGLPWHSGVCYYGPIPKFEAWRGRPVDLSTVWGPRETWYDIGGGGDDINLTGWFSGAFADQAPAGYALALSWPPIANESHSIERDPEIWTKTAAGEFDHYYRNFARKLGRFVEIFNMSPVVVRIAWESNGLKYPHSITDPYIAEWKTTFARASDFLREHVPGVVIDWSSIKKGKTAASNAELYPGDDHVDIVGVDYYDAWPGAASERAWERQARRTRKGGPWGLQSWLDFARAQGKKLSLPEYGIRADLKRGGGGDNDVYVRMIYAFIESNHGDIAYENYFNMGKPGQKVFPEDLNPAASAAYRELWSGTA